MKIIVNQKQTRLRVIEAINELANIVGVTMGGKGKNVILSNGNQVQIVNDGVTIAREVSFDHDPIKNTGALLAKQVAEKTNEQAGDGTTTSIVLLQAYLNKLLAIEDIADSRGFRQEVKTILDFVVTDIDRIKRPVENAQDIERVAFISSLDRDMARIIGEVFDKVGKDAAITVEAGRKTGIEYEVVDGIRLREGYISHFLVTHPDRQVAEAEMVPVIASRKSITSISDILPLLQELRQQGTNTIAFFVEDISDEVLTFLVANKANGLITPIVVKTQDLDDIEIMTGAKVVTVENGLKFDKNVLGLALKVSAAKHSTTIIGGKDLEQNIAFTVENLKKAEAHEEDEYEKNRIKRRIARLQGGVVVIRISGDNDQETREKRLKLEDALNAAKAAIEDGIIPGGGLALWLIGERMKESELDGPAVSLIINTIQQPMRKILENAGEDYDTVVASLRKESIHTGYNVVSGKYENFMETGVIDPAKVTKAALINAVSMGNMIVTAEGAVVFTMEKPE
jgi:chaperonin GroEL